jgi:Raf kinase inhibitor-like YbhB/YbcL family protein
MDVRPDTPPGTSDAAPDRPTTMDAPTSDGGTADTSTPPDGPPTDTGSPPDGGQPDTTPPTDSSSGDAPSDSRTDGPVGDGAATMVLTSSAFSEGAMLPVDFTCSGTNVSPPLQWTPGPAGTLSYAVVFTDRTPGSVLIHSIIYDIPSSVTSLPMNVEKVANPSTPAGAKQLRAYDNMTYGYMGPCPPSGTHNYEFSVRAVDVAALPGVMTTSTRAIAEPVITMHTLASGLLNSTAKK